MKYEREIIIGNKYRFFLQTGFTYAGTVLDKSASTVKIWDEKSSSKILIYIADIGGIVGIEK